MKSRCSSSEPAYLHWRVEFQSFEARCYGAVCEFVRVHFHDLLDGYYREGQQTADDFPAWVFERDLRDAEGSG